MVKVDVCIETFFTQFSYEERIKKVAAQVTEQLSSGFMTIILTEKI